VLRLIPVTAVGLATLACGGKQPESAPAPQTGVVETRVVAETLVVRDTVRVRDAEHEQRIARLELQLLEKDAQIGELESRLEEAHDQVVRAMAKLQTASSRAEAASGMAEAELAIQTRQRAGGAQAGNDVAQAKRLMQQSTDAFNKGNYGGALYLANQAKLVAAPARALSGERAVRGEVPFASPVALKLSGRSNVRDGPGPNFKVAFTLEGGSVVTGHSYTEGWIRISDQTGRAGWISRALIGRGQ
jgi:uncharacterized protein YgiM (DUF1202 family)